VLKLDMHPSTHERIMFLWYTIQNYIFKKNIYKSLFWLWW
jgi:hypothetical protein